MNINDKITIDTYARGDNNRVVTIGNLKLWFSYNTVIAFEIGDNGTIVSENVFSQTTGEHINAIQSDKAERFERLEFESRLKILFNQIIL